MNTILLLFFALPIAVIIISIALQKIFHNPFLVSAIIFAVFLVVTFIIGNLIFLIATIAYAILAFVTAILTKIICRLIRCFRDKCSSDDDDDDNGICTNSINSVNAGTTNFSTNSTSSSNYANNTNSNLNVNSIGNTGNGLGSLNDNIDVSTDGRYNYYRCYNNRRRFRF